MRLEEVGEVERSAFGGKLLVVEKRRDRRPLGLFRQTRSDNYDNDVGKCETGEPAVSVFSVRLTDRASFGNYFTPQLPKVTEKSLARYDSKNYSNKKPVLRKEGNRSRSANDESNHFSNSNQLFKLTLISFNQS